MLDAAHKGYEYQDLLIAARLTDVLLDRLEHVDVDNKLFTGDIFDDLTTIDRDGYRERVQIKHAKGDGTPLNVTTFTTDRRSLRLDEVVRSIVADRNGPGAAFPNTTYRVVLRDGRPLDPDLTAVLRPAASDPGPLVPTTASVRLQFVTDSVWPLEGTASPQAFAFIREGSLDRADVEWAFGRLVVEIDAPPASFDLTRPLAAEQALLDRVRRDVGAESYPNDDRSAVDVAAAIVATVRAARMKTTTISRAELLRRAQLLSDFGAVARSHPVDQRIEIDRSAAVQQVVERAQTAADRGVPLLLLGPPGQGKSWCCHQVLDSLTRSRWLVAEHYCYLGQADADKDARVLGERIFGSLLYRLAEIDPTLVSDHRPRFAADAGAVADALRRARERDPARRIAIVIDGLDHVTRVAGSTAGRADPSRVVADELAALAIPTGCVLIVLSQPGEHLRPLREVGADAVDTPGLTAAELLALTNRLGVIGSSSAGNQSAPLLDSSDRDLIVPFIAELETRSAGNALYATYLCREILRQRAVPVDPTDTLRTLPAFDGTLEAYYTHLVSTMESGAGVVADLLALIDFAVTRADLREIQPSIGHRIDGALDRLAPVLVEKGSQSGVRIYHESFSRFLAERFSHDAAAMSALMGSVTAWLVGKGFFNDSRAFRFLLPMLARSGRHREVLEAVTIEFSARAVAAGHTASSIGANLTVGARSAVAEGNWPALVRCIELSRAARTYEWDCMTDPLVGYLDVPLSLIGTGPFSERLLHDGRPTLPGRLGVELCGAADAAGAVVPWAEYLDEFDRENARGNGSESDRRVAVASLRGQLRLAANGAEKVPSPERLARWLDGNHLPARAVVDAISDTLGTAFAEDTLRYSSSVPDLSLSLAERIHKERDRSPTETLRRVVEIACRNPAPGGVDRLLALGLGVDEIPGLTTDLQDRLLELTRKVQDAHIPYKPAPIFPWIDLCATAARVNVIALATAESLVVGEGWYRCWLRFVFALSRAEALDSSKRSTAAADALGILVEERNPFVGSPRACDLYGLDEPITRSLRRAIALLNDDEWPRALDYLAEVSRNMTTTLQGVFGGPLPPTLLLVMAVEAMTTPSRRAPVEALTSLLLTKRAGNLLYSYVGEFHLAAARIALATGDREAGIKEWQQACQMLTAYGYHKDTTIYELLDSLPSLIAVDQAQARAALEIVQPLVWRTYRHTDGKETRHGPARWWALLAEVDPVALSKLISPALLSQCNLLNRTLEGARLDLWQAQWAKTDPIVSGALRLSLGPGLDKRDPDALRRLCESGGPGDVVIPLVRLLLARADERPADGAVTNEERLERQRTTVHQLNEVARAFGAPVVEAEAKGGIAKGSPSQTHARISAQSRSW